MTITNDIGINDHYVHNLPANREFLGYSRKNRKVGNIAEITFWKQVYKKKFHGIDFNRQYIITTDYDVIHHPSVVMRELEEFILEHYEAVG